MGRRQAEAQAAVSAAQATGKPPKLSSLLVEPSWKASLKAEFNRPHMASLQRFMEAEWVAHTVFPVQPAIFRSEPRPIETNLARLKRLQSWQQENVCD